MPRRSKIELSPETINELETQFFEFLQSLNPDESKKFFNEFLTGEEKMMMYKRLALYWALFEGYSLASIQRMLGITHDTTRLYNKKKNEMSDEFREMVKRITANAPKMEEHASQPVVEEVMEETPMENESVDQETINNKQSLPSEEGEKETVEMSEAVEEKNIESEQPASPDASPGGATEEQMVQEDSQEVETSAEETQTPQEDMPMEETSENGEEEGKEKKKKGFGRFFGF